MAERERAVAAKKGPGTTPQPGNKPSHNPRAVAVKKENVVAPQPGNKPKNNERPVAAKQGHGVAAQPVRTPNNQQRVAGAKRGQGPAPQQGNRHNPHESNIRRKRKQKRKYILLILVAIVSCITFAGSGVLIAIGYLNPGSIGLGLLGAGAVLYFGTITFLVCCCICLTNMYPARQLQSTLSRLRRRPAGNGPSVVNPPAGGRAQVRPPNPNPPNGHIGPVRPNQQKGQQPQDPTPKVSHSGDFSTIAVTSTGSDERSSSDYSLEPQRKDMNTKTLQFPDYNITTDEEPPVDVKIVSHPKKEQCPQEKTTTDSSCEDSKTEPSSDPPIDVRIVSHPKKEQTRQEKTTTDSNTEMSADPLIAVRIISNPKCDTSHDKADTALQTTTTTTSQTANPPDGVSISHCKQDIPQEKKTDKHSSSEDTSSASDPPIDVRIVPNPQKHREKQNVPTTEDFGNNIIPFTSNRSHIKEAIPHAHRSGDPASTSSAPPTDEHFVSQHKQNQQHKKMPLTTPDSVDFIALGSDPASHVRVSPHQRIEKHMVKNPTAAQSEDPTALLSMDPHANVSPVPKLRKAQRTREDIDVSTCSRDFVWVPAEMLPVNLKAVVHSKQDQQQRAKKPSASDSEVFAAPQAIPPLTTVEAHRKQERHHLDTEPKGPRSADVPGLSTEAVHQLRLASHLKNQPHSQHHVLKVSSSGGCGSAADVDTSSSTRPSPSLMDNPNHHPPSAAHPIDMAPTAEEPPEGKFQQPHKLEQHSQSSIPPVGQTDPSSNGDASFDRKDTLS